MNLPSYIDGIFHTGVLFNDVYSEWLEWVKIHVEQGVPMTKLAAEHHFDVSKLKYRVKLYELHGEGPFADDYEYRAYIIVG